VFDIINVKYINIKYAYIYSMISFITFGAGDQKYYDAGNRLIEQAQQLNVFDNIKLYTDIDLKSDISFWNKHQHFIENNKRGYGYWLWKPYLIHKNMENMVNGDILLYLDCGCELDINKKEMMIKQFELIKQEYIIGTYACSEIQWTKMDLFFEMDMLHHPGLNTLQHQAGALLFLVCDKTRKLVKEWYELGCNYHNIDDTPSIRPNLIYFKEHRHDQSIFSLITKKYNLFSSYKLTDSVDYARNISGISII